MKAAEKPSERTGLATEGDCCRAQALVYVWRGTSLCPSVR